MAKLKISLLYRYFLKKRYTKETWKNWKFFNEKQQILMLNESKESVLNYAQTPSKER